MRHKSIYFAVLSVLSGCFIFFVPNSSIIAQTTSLEKSKVKKFGSSLKKFREKKNKSKINNRKNNGDEVGEETIRVKTDLVVSDVLIVNEKGNAVSGLKPNDFVVTENGTAQKIELFSFGENESVPKRIILIVDYSGNLPFYTENNIDAAKTLVDKLNPQDKMAIVSDEIKLLTDFTNDKIRLKNCIESLKKRSRLSSDGNRGEGYGALLAALSELFDRETIRPIVIFQTSGGEYNLLKPKSERFKNYYRERDYSFNNILTAIEKSRATIYTIIPQIRLVELSKEERLAQIRKMHQITSETVWAGIERDPKYIKDYLEFFDWEMPSTQAALIEISKFSGGYAEFLEKSADAEKIYAGIFTFINNRYVIGYYSTNQESDGKQINIKIEVRGHPEYVVVGRNGYINPEPKK